MVIGIEIILELNHMDLGSLRLVFLLPLLSTQSLLVVTKGNSSHNPGYFLSDLGYEKLRHTV